MTVASRSLRGKRRKITNVANDAPVTGYELAEYAFHRPPEFADPDPPVHPVAIVGGGLSGLALAGLLGLRGVPVVLLDQDASSGAWGTASRGIAYSKRTLEILDRLGVAERIRALGRTWNEGRIFDGEELIEHFVIQPEANQKWPAFINLQQFHTEEYLAERISQLESVELRWQSKVVGVEQDGDVVTLAVSTPIGEYRVRASWVVACDGANSEMQVHLGLHTPLHYFDDMWAITDLKVDMPDVQRTFWLNYPYLDQGAAIMHCMSPGMVRVDWQIIHLDPDEEVKPARVRERLASFLGREDFEVVSIGRFQFKTRLMERFVHGRVIFAGDAAHELPPYGARGGNGGIQDAENLAWKLEAVLRRRAGERIVETYELERHQAAVENIAAAAQSSEFIWPSTHGARLFRDAVLRLARRHQFAKALVNTGRSSKAIHYLSTPLSVGDDGAFLGGIAPGEAAFSCAVADGYLLDRWDGRFTAVYFVEGDGPAGPLPTEAAGFPLDHVVVSRSTDVTGDLFRRYDAGGGALYVLRPDVHVAGRSRTVTPEAAVAIVERSLAQAHALPETATVT